MNSEASMAGRDHRLTENGTNWEGRHWISVAKYIVWQSFVFIDKLLCDI
jgi:hypothetical protein